MSLAIGKEGQNARLAAKLTGWRIDIQTEGSIMQAGGDLYPPPEPTMEAIPAAGGASSAHPSGHGRGRAVAGRLRPPRPPRRAGGAAPEERESPEVALTPEQEAVAEFEEEAAPVAASAEAEPATEEAPAAAARSAATGGLRFAEDIGGRRDLDEEDAPQPQPQRERGRRRGRRAAAGTPARTPQPTPRKTSRRFEVEDEDIEEGLSELHPDEEGDLDGVDDSDGGDNDQD